MSNTSGPSNPGRREPGNQDASALQRAVTALEKMKSRLDTVERAGNEPIAIIGMACRFPGGGTNPERFWQVLDDGVDAIGEIPVSRWHQSAIAGEPQDTRWAALLEDLSGFDANFFGISPREAETLDPQHRMLLEMAWEAMEDAGLRPEALSGSRTGVLVGMSNNDYQILVSKARADRLDSYCGSGNIFSIAAGRVAFTYNFQGPTFTIDTACSSALVATAQACHLLRTGDAELMLVGGVNAILAPYTMESFHVIQALSADGRCKTFDARANGYARGEGCGLIVLKKLSNALRDGDRIRGVIRGWAVNHDGRSTGLTTPNVLSQQAMLRQALARAHFTPTDIDYIEVHGTGTPLGDPIEADALREVMGVPRPDGSKLILGAGKTNVGHLEGAAGMVGIIKILLSMEHEQIPKNLHFKRLNPRISFEGAPFLIPTAHVPWPRKDKPRRAGTSAFGFSGTNAHVIVEEPPATEPRGPVKESSAYLLPLSAKTPQARAAYAADYAEWFAAGREEALYDIVHTATLRRTHHEHRLAAVARTKDEFAKILGAYARGEAPAGVVEGQVSSRETPRIVFVFSGQGSQWPSMGKTLLDEEPVFRAKVDQIDALIRQRANFSVLDELRAPEDSSRLSETEIVQPALFALQVGLVELLQSWGVTPAAVLGHSVGEVTAAYISGVLSLEDAVRLIVLRGKIMQKATGRGKMVWVALPAAEAALAITGLEDKLAIAAINDPGSVVLSGDSNALEVIIGDLAKRGVATRPLRVNYAFHSPQMAPLARELVEALGPINAKPGSLPMYSSLTGKRIDGNALVAEYWGLNVLSTVNFADAAIHAFADNHFVAMEIGPHPVLLANLEQCASTTDHAIRAISTLRRQSGERQALLETVGALHTLGLPVDWSKLLPEKGQLVALPAYPWQRKRHWIETSALAPSIGKPTGHQLLGNEISIAGVESVSESTLDPNGLAWLNDHRVFGEVIVPGAALLEMARAAGALHLGADHCQVRGFVIQAPLRIVENTSQRVQVLIEKAEREELKVRIYAQPRESNEKQSWTLHAQGTVRATDVHAMPNVNLDALRERKHTTRDVTQLYEAFARLGLDYGAGFQGIRQLRRLENEILAEVVLPDALASNAASYGMHPALLDAGLQCLMAAGESTDDTTYLPFEFGEATFFGPAPMRAWVHARLEPGPKNAESVIGSVTWMDETGRVVATVSKLRAKRASAEAMRQSLRSETSTESLYSVDWQSRPLPDGSSWPVGDWLIVCEPTARIEPLQQHLASAGSSSHRASVDTVLETLTSLTGTGIKIAGVLCWWDDAKTDSVPHLAQKTAASALQVVQSIVHAGLSTKLFLVTHRGIAQGAGESLSMAQSPLWGFGRVVRNEHPDLGLKLIDIDGAASEAWWRELAAADDEPEVIWRNEKRFVARLVKANSTRGLRIPEGECVALAIRTKGELSNLFLETAERRAPTAGEVEIEVHASGLNFRDVLNALGMYPGEAGPLGGECAGIVTAVGPGVAEFVVGDRVMALAAGAFRSFVTLDARFVARIPGGVSLAQAATIPLVFLTAHYALHDLGQLKPGERILVHAAAGGVGMAAVQMARQIGAEVLATASPPKWSVVRGLGVEHIANSRTLEFAGIFREATRGRGVDVVLNSLAGDFIDASLSLLSPGGRFLEMGKTDIRTAESIKAAYPDRQYRAFDLPEAGPDRIREMFTALLEGFASGALKPLPLRGFGLTEAEEAFRTMAQAQHIGKIVLRAVPRRTMAKNATVLVTGGLGALGMHVARWLWEKHRVSHIVLASRHAPSPKKIVEIERLRAEGATITIATANVGDPSSVRSLVETIPSEFPLRGVIHAAGVIDDGLISDQDGNRFATVFAPKVHGAWYLHETTRNLPLDFFVMFSSVASVLGSAGQSNYAAANAFLDALAHHRQAEGLPAQSVHWGAWSEGGMAAELSETLQSRHSRMGMGMLSPAQGIALLGAAHDRPECELVAMSLDLQALGRNLGHEIPAIWRSLVATKALTGATRQTAGSWREHVSRLSEQAREAEVSTGLREDVAKVMLFGSANEVPEERPLQELGLDSLMAVELRNAISARVGARLPATLLFDYPTVKALRQHLLDKVLVFEAPIPTRVQQKPMVTQTDDAIAIVGAGCRFPGGVRDLDDFWRLLENEIDAIREVPKDRWDIDAFYDPNPDAPGKMTTRWGGFLDELDRFEPGFFGISRREAESLDPQQRLLLETTWEALERAGIPADRLMGTDTGVYVGICSNDYQQRTMTNMDAMNAYSLLGTAHSAIVGRISYWLGLQGPNMAVDTACSSSLVAVHLACRAIRAGECSMAIAGGVNVMLSPAGTVYFSRLKAMSPTGRCHTFAAEADGYVRSEGCAMVVLKRLSDAIRDGDSILALIRGTAINQDGRSQGLTAPNGPAQEKVIRSALSAAGVRPAEIDYVEAHGTGTPLGDPIEVQAMANVLGEGRDADKPVLIGSVKTNIGHSEGAAGIAGLVKATLCLMHEAIPRSLHFTNPNPHIAWSDLSVRVANESLPWRRNGKRRLAGVSSFGFSGTNAHVILEEAPREEARTQTADASVYFLPLSAKTPEALGALAANYAEWLNAHPNVPLHDVVFTASLRRTHHEHRLAALARTHEEFAKVLGGIGRDENPAGVVQGHTLPQGVCKIVFVFPGQGSQWIGMGRQLLADEPIFRDVLETCEPIIYRESGFSLLEQLAADEPNSRLTDIDVIQPLLFAIEIALTALWRSWGVVPDCVVGHSMGEVAAAHVAGILELDDAVKIICRRSRLLKRIGGHGAMGLIELSMADAQTAIAGYEAKLAIAVSNGPRSTVLSGDPDVLEGVLTGLESKGIFCRRIKVDVASHSPQVDPLQSDLLRALDDLKPFAAKLPMHSTVTGQAVQGPELVGTYWAANLRLPVRFSQVTQELTKMGHHIFVEMSPHPILLPSIEENLGAVGIQGAALASMRRQSDPRQTMLESLGSLYAYGCLIDWETRFPDRGKVVALPPYPWQRERYWLELASPQNEHAPTEDAFADQFYSTEWRPTPMPPSVATSRTVEGTWLVLMDSTGLGEALCTCLSDKGAHVILAEHGKSYARVDPRRYRIDISQSEHYEKLLQEVTSGGVTLRGVLHMFNLDAPQWSDTSADSLRRAEFLGPISALYLTQALVRLKHRDKPRLWLVSRGAIAHKGATTPISVAQAPLWNLGRTIMLEHPEFECTCIDLDAGADFDGSSALFAVLAANDAEDQLALRRDGWYVARLVRKRLDGLAAHRCTVRPDAAYLVTGGLEGIGLSVAQWLVEAGARHIALIGPPGPSASAQHALENMRASKADIRVYSCDVSQPDEVAETLRAMSDEWPPLRGIIHAAGLLEDHTLLELSADHFRRVFAPKIDGAWNLHVLTQSIELDFFILYSSVASLLGAPGQGNYAAANGFLDALAHARRSIGLPATSIQWGAFESSGIAADKGVQSRITSGMTALSSEDGTAVLSRLLGYPQSTIAVMKFMPRQWIDLFPQLAAIPYFKDLLTGQGSTRSTLSSTDHDDFRKRLAAVPISKRAQVLEQHIREVLGKILKLPDAEVGRHAPFQTLGVDSLMSLELRNRLESSLGLKLSATLLFTYPHLEALTAFLLTESDLANVTAATSQRLAAETTPVLHDDEPIAVIGEACRFPGGGTNPDRFWQALLQGVDAIREVTPLRWTRGTIPDDNPGANYAALLDDIDQFDAAFFGISPREAEVLDPQQRILLEVTWEALENAGQPVDRLAGSNTGVYIGITALDYQHLILEHPQPFGPHLATGTMMATAAGRLSFVLGLQGPAIALDTACSSSLVAIHLACQSLRKGETSLAIAGGVNALIAWQTMVMLSTMHALSPDGRCKTLDARANGYVRGEGCGIVVLKRLEDAMRDGDQVLALIRGSAMNQDGRSTGLTTPNVLAQRDLLRQVLENARLTPDAIGYVEMHGTGTPLGDPIEADALREVFGKARVDGSNIFLGALKTNIGHLEPAAGVASVVKVIGVLQHEQVPSNLHFRALNPRIAFDGTPFTIPTKATPWLRSDKPRRAGVSAFGLSGTNAHVILEEAPEEPARVIAESTGYLLLLSAKTPAALASLAESYTEWFAANPTVPLHDVVYTASVRRMHHGFRLAAVATTREEFVTMLRAFARNESSAGIVQGRMALQGAPRVVFVFSGQGSQWAGMGQTLLEQEPVFRAKLEEIDALVQPLAHFSLLEELQAPDVTSRLDETEVVQASLFALQVGLFEIFKSWGIVPHAVVGHSVGEIAAAHISGALSLEDAVRTVVLRGRIMQKATGRGKMVWVALPAKEAEEAIAGLVDRISIAAINDPSSVVLSGETRALDALVEVLDKRGIVSRPLRVNYAFHSPQMDPLAREFVATLKHVETHPNTLPMYSTVTGSRIEGQTLTTEYWGRNIRATVNLADAIRTVLDDDHRILVEIGPHPVLLANLEQCARVKNVPARVVSTLRRDGDENKEMKRVLGVLYTEGLEGDWKKLLPEDCRVVSLPAYPWQRERYWIDSPTKREHVAREIGAHPLLGRGFTPAAQPELHLWECRISVAEFPYLNDCRLQGEVVFPAAGFVEAAIAAANLVLCSDAAYLEELRFERILTLQQDEVRIFQVLVREEAGGRATITMNSKRHDSKDWVQHASGSARIAVSSTPTTETLLLDSLLPKSKTIDSRTHYARMAQAGLAYGTAFQGVEQVRQGSNEIVASVKDASDRDSAKMYHLHPTFLDACFQAATWSLGDEVAGDSIVPAKITHVRWHRHPTSTSWVHGHVAPQYTDQSPVLSLVVRDAQGQMVFEVGALHLRAVDSSRPTNADTFERHSFHVQWHKADLTGAPPKRAEQNHHWLVILDENGIGSRLAAYLRARGDQVTTATAEHEYSSADRGTFRLDCSNVEHWERLFASAFTRDGCHTVVHCGALDGASWQSTSDASLRADVQHGPVATLRLVQAILRQDWLQIPQLYVLTRGAQQIGHTRTLLSVSQSTLWGLGRVLAMEHPELRPRLIDLCLETSPDELVLLARELTHSSDEDEIALRADGRYVARLASGSWKSENADVRVEDARGRPHRLEMRKPGALENLCLRPLVRRVPGPGEVEIEVDTSSLTFLDIMKATGTYPGKDSNSSLFGGECSGRIVAMGENVRGFHVGQEVIACATGTCATHVTTRTEFVAPMPPGLSFEQSATIPLAFMTIQWALHHVGRLRRGERILVHSAAGATGIAAIQYAKSIGAEILATASTEERRIYLRSLGIQHVMNSRTLDFADEIMTKTNGHGVDVVLNSLTGDALVKSLELLAPYGRFLEIGKTDIYENRRLGLLPFRNSLSYTAIDLAGMADDRPEQFGALLHEVVAKFHDGTFQPVPVATFSANEAESAFQVMAQARHIGKIAVRMRGVAATLTLAGVSGAQIRADRTYLIIGDLDGIGLAQALWMAEQGANHLVLVGQSAPNQTTETFLQEIKAKGANVRVLRVDVTQRNEVDSMMGRIASEMPVLRGIVHSAGMSANQTMRDMKEDEFLRALEPRILGAWNLHEASKAIPLDFFVVYSSASALMGTSGQAHGAAANAFFSALCHARTADGLPGMSIQWDGISSIQFDPFKVGETTNSGDRGHESDSIEAVQLFARVLRSPRTEIGLMRFGPAELGAISTRGKRWALLRDLLSQPEMTTIPARGALLDKLKEVPPDERIIVLETHVIERIGQILRLDPARIDRLATFSAIGMDSLMGLELRNRLEPDLGLKLSATLLFAHPTPAALALLVLDLLSFENASPALPLPADVVTETQAASGAEFEESMPARLPTNVEKSLNPATPSESAVEPETTVDDIEARIAAKLASLEKYLD